MDLMTSAKIYNYQFICCETSIKKNGMASIFLKTGTKLNDFKSITFTTTCISSKHNLFC